MCYSEHRNDSCCKNMDRIDDSISYSISALMYIIELNKKLDTYSNEYIDKIQHTILLLKNGYENIFSKEQLDEVIELHNQYMMKLED